MVAADSIAAATVIRRPAASSAERAAASITTIVDNCATMNTDSAITVDVARKTSPGVSSVAMATARAICHGSRR